jgi:RNA polymerase sigma-70 factor (ECF subfamily)
VPPQALRSRSAEAGTTGSATVEDFYDRYSGLVYRFCLRELGSREEAEDVVQETFLNAWRRMDEGFTPDTPGSWLLRIAGNLCVSRHRARAARVQTTPMVDETRLAGPDLELGQAAMLSAALAELTHSQRQVFVLREWRGLSYDEIAEELDLSYAGVATKVSRARKTVAAALERSWGTRVRDRLASFSPVSLLTGLRSILDSSETFHAVVVAAAVAGGGALVAAPLLHGHAHHARPAVQASSTHAPARARHTHLDLVVPSTLLAVPRARHAHITLPAPRMHNSPLRHRSHSAGLAAPGVSAPAERKVFPSSSGGADAGAATGSDTSAAPHAAPSGATPLTPARPSPTPAAGAPAPSASPSPKGAQPADGRAAPAGPQPSTPPGQTKQDAAASGNGEADHPGPPATPPGQAKKASSDKANGHGAVPPGQLKKSGSGDGSHKSGGPPATPPGQAKKNADTATGDSSAGPTGAPPGQAKKNASSSNAAGPQDTPPGQAKKDSSGDASTGNGGGPPAAPPGQAKKDATASDPAEASPAQPSSTDATSTSTTDSSSTPTDSTSTPTDPSATVQAQSNGDPPAAPPGQAKKDSSDSNGSGGSPPGQSKDHGKSG